MLVRYINIGSADVQKNIQIMREFIEEFESYFTKEKVS